MINAIKDELVQCIDELVFYRIAEFNELDYLVDQLKIALIMEYAKKVKNDAA